MTTLGRLVLRNAAGMLALSVLQRSTGLVAITILARVLDARGLGAYTFVQSTSQTFYGLARLGVDAGLHVSLAQARLPEEKARAEALLGEAMALFLLIGAAGAGLLCLLAQPIAARVFAAPELEPLVTASAVLFAGQVAMQAWYTVFAGLSAFLAYAQVMAWINLATMAVTVSCAVAFGASGAIWGAAVAGLVAAFAMGMWLRTGLASHGLTLRLRWPAQHAGALLTVGLPFYAGGLLLIPTDFLCVGYLSRVAGVEALGELRVTQALMSAATMIPAALSGPFLSHLARRIGTGEGREAVLDQVKAIWVLSLVLTCCLGAVWPLLVDIIFGGSFGTARTVGVVALAALVPTLLLSTLTGAILALRHSFALFAIGGSQALVIGLFAPVLISGHGLAGYLVVQTLSMLVGTLASAAVLARLFPTGFLQRWMIPLAGLTLVLWIFIAADVVVAEILVARMVMAGSALILVSTTIVTFVLTDDERARGRSVITTLLQRIARFRDSAS